MDASESIQFKIPHCWKSHVAAHLLLRYYDSSKLATSRLSIF